MIDDELTEQNAREEETTLNVNFDKNNVELFPGVVDTGLLMKEDRKNSLAFLQYIVDEDVRDAKVAGKACYDMLVEQYRQQVVALYGKEPTQEELDTYRNSRECRYNWVCLMDIAKTITAEGLEGFIEYLKEKEEEQKKFGRD